MNLEKDTASLRQPICNVGSDPTQEIDNRRGRWFKIQGHNLEERQHDVIMLMR